MKTENQNHFRDPVACLRHEIISRQKKNPQYSISAFARDLGMSQSLLSLILSRKRALTLSQAHKVAALLEWSPDEQQAFLRATEQFKKKSRKPLDVRKKDQFEAVKLLEIEKFHVVSEWYHLAILDLTTTKGFKSNSKWIAQRLGISELESRVAVERLLNLGLLLDESGQYVKTGLHIRFLTEKSLTAVRHYHKQMLNKALEELNKTQIRDFEKRFINSITLSFDPEEMQEAQKMILKFQDAFAKKFTKKSGQEVYQFNSQLFSLTKEMSKKESS